MKNFTLLKVRQRIYDKANAATWLISLMVVSIAILLNTDNASPILYIIPALFGISFILMLATHSFAKVALSVFYYIFTAVIISISFSTAMTLDQNGIVATVWLGVLVSTVFAVLTTSYIIRTVENRHLLVLKAVVSNVALVVASSYVLGNYVFPQDINPVNFMLSIIFTVFFLVIIAIIINLVLSSKAYRFSLSRKKVLGQKFRNASKETNENEEEKFIKKATEAAKNNDYIFKTFKAHGRKQGYLYKDNVSLIVMPLDLGFSHDKTSLPKSAKVRKKTFDKIIYSVINRFSARSSLPNSPVVILFVVQDKVMDNPTSYEVISSEAPMDVTFIPFSKLSQWLKEIDDKESDTIVVFPELSSKQKENRDKSYFMTQVYPEQVNSEEIVAIDNVDSKNDSIDNDEKVSNENSADNSDNGEIDNSVDNSVKVVNKDNKD